MNKIVIFNVGGALSIYAQLDCHRIIYDLGKSEQFNPITDFLIPLYKKQGRKKVEEKYSINQLIISHPHMDHISAIEDFDINFNAGLITTPNDKDDSNKDNNIDYSQFDDTPQLRRLREMIKDRILPLRPVITKDDNKNRQYISYIPPKIVASSDRLSTEESYANNISLVCLLIVNGYSIFMPGDIMKNGMECLLDGENSSNIRASLNSKGLDILIAPHHGLKSSFPNYLFDYIKDNKTKCINVISEKTNNKNENREVDGRYYDEKYCNKNNNLDQYGVKTSNGHVIIDFDNKNYPIITTEQDCNQLIEQFME